MWNNKIILNIKDFIAWRYSLAIILNGLPKFNEIFNETLLSNWNKKKIIKKLKESCHSTVMKRIRTIHNETL